MQATAVKANTVIQQRESSDFKLVRHCDTQWPGYDLRLEHTVDFPQSVAKNA